MSLSNFETLREVGENWDPKNVYGKEDERKEVNLLKKKSGSTRTNF